jgi:CBS domain-containing protein
VIEIIKIEDWMSKPVRSVTSDTPLKVAIDLMDQNNIGGLPVVEKGDRPVGVITERDILRRVCAKKVDIEGAKVSDIMTKNPVTVDHSASILEVTRLMSENNFRRLLVVKNGKLIGVITAKDVIEVLSA